MWFCNKDHRNYILYGIIWIIIRQWWLFLFASFLILIPTSISAIYICIAYIFGIFWIHTTAAAHTSRNHLCVTFRNIDQESQIYRRIQLKYFHCTADKWATNTHICEKFEKKKTKHRGWTNPIELGVISKYVISKHQQTTHIIADISE